MVLLNKIRLHGITLADSSCVGGPNHSGESGTDSKVDEKTPILESRALFDLSAISNFHECARRAHSKAPHVGHPHEECPTRRVSSGEDSRAHIVIVKIARSEDWISSCSAQDQERVCSVERSLETVYPEWRKPKPTSNRNFRTPRTPQCSTAVDARRIEMARRS